MTKDDSISIQCPICNKGTLKITSILYRVPYFDKLAMFTMACPLCNFSHNDVFSAEQRKPSRWTLKVDNPSLLRARVVRSGSGTIRFPEFGIDIEPGPTAESFITNVEGVLLRTKPVVESAIRFAETEAQKHRGREVLSMMEQAMQGELNFTLIIEDPAGISGILPNDLSLVVHEELSREEASKLRGAPMWVDTVREEYKEQKG